MQLSHILRETLIDFPGRTALIAFTPGCNFKCPACYAKKVITGEKRYDISEYIGEWTDGVVISGGEPTLQEGLLDFAKKLKERGLAVKLDTNGSNPYALKELLEEKAIDYVAMDIKGPKYFYDEIAGVKINLHYIEKSMKLLSDSNIDYEFRTTVVPVVRRDYIYFLNEKEAEDTAKWIIEVTKNSQHKHYLQKFVPIKGELLDKRLEEFNETPDELMQEIHEKVVKYLPNCKIR